jgi:hypothetical protein
MAAEDVLAQSAELLWTGALAATPIAALVGLVCLWHRVRPATRHMLWAAVLASFLTPALGAMVWRPHWFRSDRLIAVADSVLDPAAQPPVNAVKPPTGTGSAGLGLPRSALQPAATRQAASDRPGKTPEEGPVPDPLLAPRPVDLLHKREVQPLTASVPSVVAAPPIINESPAARRPEPAQPAEFGGSVLVPVEPIEASKAAGKAAHAEEGVRAWLLSLLRVRDALAELPPVPLPVWMGGALLVVVVTVWRRCMGAVWIGQPCPPARMSRTWFGRLGTRCACRACRGPSSWRRRFLR